MKYKKCFIYKYKLVLVTAQTLSNILKGFTTLQTSEFFENLQIKFVKFVPTYKYNHNTITILWYVMVFSDSTKIIILRLVLYSNPSFLDWCCILTPHS